jgi:sulfite exporter TauE/SafE
MLKGLPSTSPATSPSRLSRERSLVLSADTFVYYGMLTAGGLLGSAHCLGMCGGFVLALGAGSRSAGERLTRQLTYAAGRIWVYVLAGASLGFAGWRLGLELRAIVVVQAWLSLLAGGLLVYEAAASLGWIRRPAIVGGCALQSFGSLLRSRRLPAVFAAGVWNGLLPCGLLYGYLALAAGSGTFASGAAVMLLFGVGTIPALLFLGMSGALAPVRYRERLLRVAAVCLLLTGVWTIYRGVAHLQAPADEPACPLCHATATASNLEP